jgi:hypothetical protein
VGVTDSFVCGKDEKNLRRGEEEKEEEEEED